MQFDPFGWFSRESVELWRESFRERNLQYFPNLQDVVVFMKTLAHLKLSLAFLLPLLIAHVEASMFQTGVHRNDERR